MVGRSIVVILLSALALGCDPPTGPPIIEWNEPALPAPVVMSCPEGWIAEPRPGGHQVCAPWAGPRPTCGPYELLVPGSPCERLAPPCTATDLPVLEAGAVLVQLGSAPGGDGSMARPFATLRDALATGADVIALGPGEHVLDADIQGFRIYGACPDTTALVISEARYLDQVTFSRLRVSGASGELWVGIGHSLTLEDVLLDDIAGTFVGGALTMRRVRVTGSDMGVYGTEMAAIDLSRVWIDGPRADGIVVEPEATRSGTLDLNDVLVTDVGGEDGVYAVGFSLTAERVVVEDVPRLGVAARSPSVALTDVVVRGAGQSGISVLDATTAATLSRVRTEGGGAGIVLGAGNFTGDQLWVDGASFLGVNVQEGTAALTHVGVHGSVGAGIDVGFGASVTASDVHVADVTVVPDSVGSGGGVLVEDSANATLMRVGVTNVASYGVGVATATLHASDVTVEGVRSVFTESSCQGIAAADAATLTLERASVNDADIMGLAVYDSSAVASDVWIEHIVAADDEHGDGVVVVSTTGAPTTLTLDRAMVRDTVQWGLIVSGAGTDVHATDLTVDHVARAPCGATLCPGVDGGGAIVAHDGALLEVSDFYAGYGDLAGAIGTDGVWLRLVRGRLEHNGIGLLTTTSLRVNFGSAPGVDLTDVVLEENGVRTGTSALMVTAPAIVRPTAE